MNIKIKSDNVTALFPNTGSLSYDKLYLTLLNSLPADAFVFTKRTPGSGYLQWDLPGEGWLPLSKADPLVAETVRAEKERLFNLVMDAFASNILLGQKVLTVPSEDYIFFRPNDSGKVEVKITVWGYRNPSPVMDGPMIGRKKEKATLQETVVSFIYDGQRLSEYEFLIDGFQRVTDKNGTLRLGMLPIGKSYELKLDGGRSMDLCIVEGQRDYPIDVTVYVTITVAVNRDGAPAANVACQIDYWGHNAMLTTAENGMATTTIPLDRKASDCRVSVEDQTQQKLLTTSENLFQFELVTPMEPEKPEPVVPEESEEPEQPAPSEPIEPSEPMTPEEPIESDEPAEPIVPEQPEEPDNPEISDEPLSPEEPFFFSPDIKISVVDEMGRPMSGASILFEQNGRSSKNVQLDANGTTFLSFGDYANNVPLSVTLAVQGKTFKPIVFELEADEDEYLLQAVVTQRGNKRLWELLAALGGFIATSAVFYIILQILI